MALALAGCAGGAAHPMRYTGPLLGCGLATATLTVQGTAFTFTPGDGVLTLQGTLAADGGFAATLNTQPPGKPPFMLRVAGRVAGEAATLEYATPQCRAPATLALVHQGLL